MSEVELEAVEDVMPFSVFADAALQSAPEAAHRCCSAVLSPDSAALNWPDAAVANDAVGPVGQTNNATGRIAVHYTYS